MKKIIEETITDIQYISIDQYIEKIKDQTGKPLLKRTVKEWFEKGYIIGARIKENSNEIEIPNDTRAPYTRRNGKNNPYKSVVNGIKNNYEVTANLYGMYIHPSKV